MRAKNQEIQLSLLRERQVSLVIKREDLIHPVISGNKYRKLKYNLTRTKEAGATGLLTFGGAYSNHILAAAFAGKAFGLKTVGVIRGEELAATWKANPTLSLANSAGMQFKFITRESYRKRDETKFLDDLRVSFPNYFVLPEGGTNALAVKGCEEILTSPDTDFDFICCSVGTGGTIAGLINSSHSKQQVLGFPAVRGDFVKKDIRRFAGRENWELQTDYHFGGYAKVNKELINFINDFHQKTQIPLDPLYTGKLLYGILDMVGKGCFKRNSKLLAIHTGGLQGIAGMNLKLKEKNLPLINL